MTKDELFTYLDEYFDERGKRKLAGWAEDSMEAAKAWNITDGTRPGAFAERQEVSAMVVRGVEKMAEKLPDLVAAEVAKITVDPSSMGYRVEVTQERSDPDDYPAMDRPGE